MLVAEASEVGSFKRPPNEFTTELLVEGSDSDANEAHLASRHAGSRGPAKDMVGKPECRGAVVGQHSGSRHHHEVGAAERFDGFRPIHQLTERAFEQDAKHFSQASGANPR